MRCFGENLMSQQKKSNPPDEQTVEPIHWKNARPQPRVRPQWDPAKLGNEMLDEMERNGRLPSSRH